MSSKAATVRYVFFSCEEGIFYTGRLTKLVPIPPFPEDLPIAQLPRISVAALVKGDAVESEKLFDACCDQGFFLLDLTTDDSGRNLLDDVERAFEAGEQFFAQDLEVKSEFKFNSGSTG